ncbi:MAG TPA: sigma 54-interacting transcriptional regulator [Kofleriaceae bacterium]|nr:sigma 54-interacting transcriptional regulator [Kofleriaceae bacterium]
MDLRQYNKLHAIRLVRETVRRWWRLELAFADDRGYVLDHADGNIFPSGNDFCRLALFSKEGFRRCNDSVKVVRDRLKGSRKKVLIHQCHLGFDVVAAPIHFGDELVGFLFTGGGYHAEPSGGQRTELFRKVREFAAPAQEDMEREHGKVPRLSETELAHLADLIEWGAAEVMEYHRTVQGGRVEATELADPAGRFPEIIGRAPAMGEVFRLLDKIVRSESTVLIHGESGTGKELIARAIHFQGPRVKKPFVVQNCSAFNDNLLESALFGHVRGAFTGAVKDQKGLFEVADGGTFFLDEIGDMSPVLQVKLLRVLQEGTFTPVGSTKQVKVDVRIIAASHKDLTKMVERGEFREDLYYRINVLKVSLPGLRDRIEDLETLTDHFLTKHWSGAGTPPRLSASALEGMRAYHWPGNIRELENEVERLIVLGADEREIGIDLLSQRIKEVARNPLVAKLAARSTERTGTLREVVESVEAEVIAQGLVRTHWNKSQLAKELGISRSNLIQKCTYYGLDRKEG